MPNLPLEVQIRIAQSRLQALKARQQRKVQEEAEAEGFAEVLMSIHQEEAVLVEFMSGADEAIQYIAMEEELGILNDTEESVFAAKEKEDNAKSLAEEKAREESIRIAGTCHYGDWVNAWYCLIRFLFAFIASKDVIREPEIKESRTEEMETSEESDHRETNEDVNMKEANPKEADGTCHYFAIDTIHYIISHESCCRSHSICIE